jgi:hypothetical protein
MVALPHTGWSTSLRAPLFEEQRVEREQERERERGEEREAPKRLSFFSTLNCVYSSSTPHYIWGEGEGRSFIT